MKKITGGTAPAILWRKFMTAAHEGIQPRGFSYKIDEEKPKYLNDEKINKIIQKSKKLDKRKNLFDSILEKFF